MKLSRQIIFEEMGMSLKDFNETMDRLSKYGIVTKNDKQEFEFTNLGLEIRKHNNSPVQSRN